MVGMWGVLMMLIPFMPAIQTHLMGETDVPPTVFIRGLIIELVGLGFVALALWMFFGGRHKKPKEQKPGPFEISELP